MSIESEVFQKVKPNFKKLLNYGFIKGKDVYTLSIPFHHNEFTAEITITNKQVIAGTVIDNELQESYDSIRQTKNLSPFSAKIKEEYIVLLSKIKEECFEKDSFQFPQTRRIVDYIQKNYHIHPEFLWDDDQSAALRLTTSKKWIGVLMAVDYHKLNSEKSGIVEIIDVKSDLFTIEELSQLDSFYPGYHMNKKNWLTIVLNDTVADEIIYSLIDASYQSVNTSNSWIIPANPKYYDIFTHFKQSEIVTWKQSSDVKVGDIIYMYVAAPYSCIMYQCQAIEVNIPYAYEDQNLSIKTLMKLKKLQKYSEGEISFSQLKDVGINAIRGPRKINSNQEKKLHL